MARRSAGVGRESRQVLLAALLLGATAGLGAHGASIAPLPAASPATGLPAGEWPSIRAAYEAARHAVVAGEVGHVARNPGQKWRVEFDGRAFLAQPDAGEWSWGLALRSYGRGAAQQVVHAPAGVDVDGGRMSYRWDDVLTEWYINDARGLEHGYTLQEPPRGASSDRAEPLRVDLAVRGGLRPVLSGSGRDVTFIDCAGAGLVCYEGLTVFDADGVHLEARFCLGQGQSPPCGERALSILVDDRTARYPLVIDPIAQQSYLKASNTEAFDNFGFAVAVSGDTVVVGAPSEDSSAIGVNGNQASNAAANSGAAYVFVRTGSMWSQQAYLKASNTGAGDEFGSAVAIAGNTIVIGAPFEDSGAIGVNGNQASNDTSNAGAAYVFVRSGASWTQQAYLKASNTDPDDQFGWSVAISGDSIVVGAGLEDSTATGVNGTQGSNAAQDAGAAYVFLRSGTTWSQQAYLKASNTGAGDRFGASVAISGESVIVGAPREDSSATGVGGDEFSDSASNSGAAYVFARSGTTWSQQAYLKASNTGAGNSFGSSVAIWQETAVVGAPGESSGATGPFGSQSQGSALGAGAAYVFLRSGSNWSQQAYLKATNTAEGDSFGASVAVSGNVIVVGSPNEGSIGGGVNGPAFASLGNASGAAYTYLRSGSSWYHWNYLKASNNSGGDDGDDAFGASIAISGGTIVIGAPSEDSTATGVNGNQSSNAASASGATYVFLGEWFEDCNGNGIADHLELAGNDCNGNGIPDDCEPWLNCLAADLNGDGVVDGADLGLLLSGWGFCP